MTAEPTTIHGFDLAEALHCLIAEQGMRDVDDVVEELLEMMSPAEYERVLRDTLPFAVQAVMPRPKPTPASRTRAQPPAASPKVTAIRDEWQKRMAAVDLRGYRGRPTSLLEATREDLAAAAATFDTQSAHAARQAAFLRGVAKAVADAGVGRVHDLPGSVQRAIAERIPK